MKRLEWRNYRRWHFLIALAVIGLLFAAFMTRVTRLSAESERVAAEQSVVILNTLLTQVLVKHAVRGKLNELLVYADTNPMRLVEAQHGVVPANYAGEISDAHSASVRRGVWYFDSAARELVYPYISRPAQLRVRLAVVFIDGDGNDVFDPDTDRVTGLHLKRSTIEGRNFSRHDK